MKYKEGFDSASSEADGVPTMTAQRSGWVEPDVLRDDGKGKGVGWAEMDGKMDRWRETEREREREEGWAAVTDTEE